MSLPENPTTPRTLYYSVMAGQNSVDDLPEDPVSTENRYLDYIARNGGGGGSTVEVTAIKTTGEKIATITVDDVATDLYASAGGSGGGAVDTVNGQTGDVVLTASDVGALPDNTAIPTKTSDLTNDSNYVADASYVHTDNNYNATAKTKLDALANIQSIGTGLSLNSTTHELTATGGSGTQVQSDWTQTDDTAVDFIKHKPTLGTAAAKDSTNAVTANSTDLVESGAVNTAVSKCNHVICVFSDNQSDVSYAKITIALGSTATDKTKLFMVSLRSNETWLIGCTYANAESHIIKCTKICGGENKIDAIKAALTYDNSVYTLTIFLKLKSWYSKCCVTTMSDETGSCTATVTSSASSTEYDAFTNEASTSTLATTSDLSGKVDKVTGKQLSTEDYTTAEKTKLGTVETNATANTVINTTVTLAANDWVGNAAPYTQTVNVTGMLATDRADCDLSVSSIVATGLDEIDDWALISKITSGAGTLTFTCYEDIPTVDLNVNVQVVRGTNGGSGSGDTYSTSEVMTGDVWIDGKPIYRRTVQFTRWNDTIDLTNWNIDNIFVDFSHSFFKAHSGIAYTAPFISNGSSFLDVYYNTSTKVLNFRANNTMTSVDTFDSAYYTILYTKTTD